MNEYLYLCTLFLENISKSRPKLCHKLQQCFLSSSIIADHSVLYLSPPPPTLCLLVFCWNCFGISPRYLCICIFIRSFTLPLKSTLHKVQGQSEITVQAKNLNPSQVRLLLQTTRLTLFVDVTTTRLEFNIYQDIRLP